MRVLVQDPDSKVPVIDVEVLGTDFYEVLLCFLQDYKDFSHSSLVIMAIVLTGVSS